MIIPIPLRRVRTTISSIHSHPFQVSLPNPRALSHISSFIPRTCNLRNVLPASCFPESYNLPSFKSRINKLDLIPLSSWPFAFLISSFVEALYRLPWSFPNIFFFFYWLHSHIRWGHRCGFPLSTSLCPGRPMAASQLRGGLPRCRLSTSSLGGLSFFFQFAVFRLSSLHNCLPVFLHGQTSAVCSL